VPENLPAGSKEHTSAVLGKLVNIFGPPEVRVEYDSGECGPYLGCYDGQTNTIHFPPGPVFEYVAAHELGHAIEHYYAGGGNEPYSYEQGEGFARSFEGMYMLTNGDIADFVCQVCNKSALVLLPDNSLRCKWCGSDYYVRLYDPSKFRMAYYSGSPPTISAELIHSTVGFSAAVLPAALFTHNPLAVPVTLSALAGAVVVKEFGYDIVAEGATVWEGVRDLAFYLFGALGGVAALRHTHKA
jgi:hypothetical protein